jgi:hypothetical protein
MKSANIQERKGKKRKETDEIGPAIACYAPVSVLPNIFISLRGRSDRYNLYLTRTKAILAASGAISV